MRGAKRARARTSQALWELLNTSESVEDYKRAWARFRKNASFLAMLQAYDMLAGMVEADQVAETRTERVVFLPANMTRDEWIATYARQDETPDA